MLDDSPCVLHGQRTTHWQPPQRLELYVVREAVPDKIRPAFLHLSR